MSNSKTVIKTTWGSFYIPLHKEKSTNFPGSTENPYTTEVATFPDGRSRTIGETNSLITNGDYQNKGCEYFRNYGWCAYMDSSLAPLANDLGWKFVDGIQL